MRDLKSVLTMHALRYPRSQPEDYIKLLYQNEFGPGHMIKDSDKALSTLLDEALRAKPVPYSYTVDPIGNGLCRIHIYNTPHKQLSNLNKAFVLTANAWCGNTETFLAKLETLKELSVLHVLPVDSNALCKFIDAYVAMGIRPISHSRIYSDAYSPSYRVVSYELFKL